MSTSRLSRRNRCRNSPKLSDYNVGPREYLRLLESAKRALSMPVIASLNGSTPAGWARFARLMQESGADAIELLRRGEFAGIASGRSRCPAGGGSSPNGCDELGPSSSEWQRAVSHIFRSTDRGQTWRHLSTIDGLFWASIFVHNQAVYLFGTDRHHGNTVIMRSRDGGETWTEPRDSATGLLLEGEYHTAPVPVVIHNGRIWRAMEDAMGGTVWGQRYRAFMMNAPVDADLLNASSWTSSNVLARRAEWLAGKCNAWLEGNAVVNSQ